MDDLCDVSRAKCDFSHVFDSLNWRLLIGTCCYRPKAQKDVFGQIAGFPLVTDYMAQAGDS